MCSLKIYFNIATLYVLLSLGKIRADEEKAVKCFLFTDKIPPENLCVIDGVPTECRSTYDNGTTVAKKCGPSRVDTNVTYTCDNKKWNVATMCTPDCGTQTEKNKFPWIVAIYNADEELTCTGTIISAFHVLTVADCFKINDDSKLIDPSNYTIIAGKHYINLNRNMNSTQKRKIAEASVHTRYSLHELVLIEVDKLFEINDDVRPACIDWDTYYEEWEFRDGNEGFAVGWEFDKTEVVPCKNLDKPNVQYWQKRTCWKNLPPDYPLPQLDDDMFCAEYVPKGESTCGKDIGSGIYFNYNQKRFFLKGFATVLDSKSNYILYTKVSHYILWLAEEVKKHKFYGGSFLIEKIHPDIGCTLPENIQYGNFSLTTGSTYIKGKWVPTSTTIFLSCTSRNTNNSVSSFRCANNEWHPSLEKAVCRKPGTCPSIRASESEEVFCKWNNGRVSCEDAPSNTTAVVKCQPFFTFPGHRPIYKCVNGEWDETFTPCTLECGVKRVDVTKLIVGGTEAAKNEYPWIVTIYNTKGNHICGGTIISRKYVLSAAHCFTTLKGVHINKNNFTIIAGKYYRDINAEESSSQIRKIKSIHIHEDFKGSLRRYRDDIALIELDKELTPTMEVEPACVDWEDAYEDIDLIDGNEGVVAGWGFTRESGLPSEVLKKIKVPFRPKNVCLENLPKDFSDQFATTDKFCAGYIDNNTNVCEGDSGGGLYYQSDRTRYFIRGIVSLTVRSTSGCDANHFALYTKVSKYLTWIASITRKVL